MIVVLHVLSILQKEDNIGLSIIMMDKKNKEIGKNRKNCQ